MILSKKIKTVLFSVAMGVGLSLSAGASGFFPGCENEFELCLENGGSLNSCSQALNRCNYMCDRGKWRAEFCY
jgi:hypothetical protein